MELSNSNSVSTKQQRIAKLAREAQDMAMDLSHHMDLEWFREAYRRTRKDGAVGIDGQTAAEYAQNLEQNLQDLLNRAKSGRYRAPAVRRVHIPKGTRGESRPIGIPTFEDKVLQRAVVMALEAVYEQDFLPCSYGFRPGRSAHDALEDLYEGLMRMGGGWVIDLDIRSYFDTVDRRQIQAIFRRRVRDGVLRRLIGKWLNAGVMQQKEIFYPEAGVPQGGVVSPILSNLYLHEVLDQWFADSVRPRLRGQAFMVRYADDAVLVFEHKEDAQKVMRTLPKRLARYGLTVHPDKTRLVRFVRAPRSAPKDHRPETFDFLGFTHYWARSRKGKLVVKQKTASDRFSRATKRISKWMHQARHWPIAVQHEQLCKKLRGYNQYYGITGNSAALSRFLHVVTRLWRKWLATRSRKAKHTWEWFNGILKRFPLPKPTPIHSRLRPVANP